MGASITLISTSITKWGKVSPKKEGITIFFAVVCLTIIHIIWYKHIRKSEVLNTGLNKKLGSLIVLWIGIFIGVAACSFIMSSPD